MKRVFIATCLATLCAAGLGAQTQADDQKKQATDPPKSDEKTVTITGCLRTGEAPNTFVLANVKTDEPTSPAVPEPSPTTPPTPPPTDPPAPPTPPTNPPTPPTPPTDPPSTPPVPPDPATPPSVPETGAPVGTSGSGDVRLIGAPANLDLSKHVGHTVSITGMFVPAGKATRPTGTSGVAGAPASDARSLNVKSMTHISETCK